MVGSGYYGATVVDELRFARSKIGAVALLLVSMLALGFLVWAAWPTEPIRPIGHPTVSLGPNLDWRHGALAIPWLGTLVLCVRQMRRARHHIVVDADGILDRSVRPDKLRWRDIRDVSLVHNEGPRRGGWYTCHVRHVGGELVVRSS